MACFRFAAQFENVLQKSLLPNKIHKTKYKTKLTGRKKEKMKKKMKTTKPISSNHFNKVL